MKISKAERKWYGSKEHFNTEKSYEEHLEDLKEKKERKKNMFKDPLGIESELKRFGY